MRDRAGQQLGDYRLLRLLGRGGFADVYLAEHVHVHTQAAIKVLYTHLNSEDIEKFHHEAHIIGSLKHPHIVEVFASGIQEGLPFLVMSYAPNGTLRQRHQQGSRLPLPLIVTYLKQIASALQYAHEHHVIHRDVKPQNMLIGLHEELLLSDFGLAIVSQSTSSQHMQNRAGTVLYMAPEQLEGKARPASDQYALAVVVYEWLCGERPFQGLPLEIAMQHQFASPQPLRQKIPSISPAIEQVVLKALAKNPKERFANVQEFAMAFEHASRVTKQHNGTASASQPFSPAPIHPTSASHPKRLSRAKVAALIGLILIIILGSFGAIHLAANNSYEHATFPSNGMMFGFDAQHTNFNPYEKVLSPTNVSRLVLDWTAFTGNSSIGSTIDSTPAVVNDTVFVGSEDHNLYAFNASTGKQLWVASTKDSIISSPAVVNGVVFVGSQDHNLYAFSASSGKQLWVASTGGQITSSPAVANGVVFVGSHDGKLYAFKTSTGKRLWATSLDGAIYSSPAIANSTIYISSVVDKLHAFDAKTGKELWATPAGFFIVSSPAIANGIVYIPSGTGYDVQYSKLYAFNAKTGKLLWAASAGTHISASPAVANGVIYTGSFNGHLYAFNASSGKQLWTTSIIGEVTSSITVVNGTVYFCTSSHKLFAFHLPLTTS